MACTLHRVRPLCRPAERPRLLAAPPPCPARTVADQPASNAVDDDVDFVKQSARIDVLVLARVTVRVDLAIDARLRSRRLAAGRRVHLVRLCRAVRGRVVDDICAVRPARDVTGAVECRWTSVDRSCSAPGRTAIRRSVGHAVVGRPAEPPRAADIPAQAGSAVGSAFLELAERCRVPSSDQARGSTDTARPVARGLGYCDPLARRRLRLQRLRSPPEAAQPTASNSALRHAQPGPLAPARVMQLAIRDPLALNLTPTRACPPTPLPTRLRRSRP